MRRRLLTILAAIAAPGCAVHSSAHAQASGEPLATRINAWRSAQQPAIVRELTDLLALPNVATDSVAIARNADMLVRMLERRGISARVLEHPGSYPAVYGELRAPGATRTVMMYAHFDGQPVREADWTDPPFSPVVRTAALERGGVPGVVEAGRDVGEWRIYARSASDDKSPIVAMLAAIDALRAVGEKPQMNLKFFLEGGEEAGSSGLGDLMSANASLLRADLWLLCDGPVHSSRRPQLTFGVRGVIGLDLTLYGPSRALHSGHYGNWAPNPAAELAEVISGMRDSEGNIRIAGFYDDVRPLSSAERASLAALPAADSSLRRELLLGRTEGGAPIGERIMAPALNVRGLASGGVGDDAANAVPVSARASIDFRLVPDQTPASVRRRVEQHFRGLGYHIVDSEPTPAQRLQHPRLIQLRWSEGPYAGYRTDSGRPFARALQRVTERTLGAPVMIPMLGGSLPVSIMADAVGAPMISVPMVNHDNNQHAFNENLRLQNLWDGIVLYASIMHGLDAEWTRAEKESPAARLEPLGLSDLMKLRAVTEVAIAPSGETVAYIRTQPHIEEDRHTRALLLAHTRGGDPMLVSDAIEPRDPRWSADGRLAFLSGGRVWLYDAAVNRSRAVTPAAHVTGTYAWSRDGRIAYSFEAAGANASTIAVLDPRTAAAPALITANGFVDWLSWSPDGTAIAFSHRAQQTTRALILDTDISVLTLAAGAIRPLVTRRGMDFGPEWSPDGRHIAFVTHDSTYSWIGSTYVAVVAANGGAPRVLTRSLGERILPGEYNLLWEPEARSLLFTVPTPEGAGIARIGVDGYVRMISRPDDVVSAPSLSADGRTIAFAATDARMPWEVFVSDTRTFRPRRLADSNPALAGRHVSPMRRVRWRSTDGRSISGILLLPAGAKPASGFPLITYLHGGPAWNFVQAFTPHGGLTKSVQSELFPVQVWAARGYAVFMPNPRGSIGFGQSFRDAVINDFGGLEVDDVLSGVAEIVNDGTVDSTRMAVVGWSHGGGLTAQTVARSGRFRAAVVGAGITDPVSMFGEMDIPPFIASYFPAAQGDSVDHAKAAAFTARLGAIRTPVLILHGENDRRVPVTQGRRLERALKAAGTEVSLITYPGQGHGFNRPSTQEDVMRRTLAWIERHFATPE